MDELQIALAPARGARRAAPRRGPRRRLADRLADRHPRVERRERVLEDHLHPPAPVDGAAAVPLAHGLAVEEHLAGGDRDEPGRARARASTCPSPTRRRGPTVAPLGHLEVDPVDGRQPALAVPEAHRDARWPRASSHRHVLGRGPGGSGSAALERMPARDAMARRSGCSSGGIILAATRTRAGSAERKGSPASRRTGPGARPGMLASGCERSDSIVGTEATSAAVYGCAGPATRVATSSSSTILPAYMTRTRLHSCETTATSCEMKIAAEPPEVLTSRSSRRICCCTVTSRAVVGSSAIDQLRLAHQAHRDHGALAHAAGELVRVLAHTRTRGCRCERSAAGRPPAAAPPTLERPSCTSATSAELAADTQRRVERRHRILVDDRERPAEQPPPLRVAEVARVPAEELVARRPSSCALAGSRSAIAIAVSVLPEPDSPTMPTISPGRDARG